MRLGLAIEPRFPKSQPVARLIISGILHVLKVSCRWRDVSIEHGHAKTIYSRYYRWVRRRILHRVFENLAACATVQRNRCSSPTLLGAA